MRLPVVDRTAWIHPGNRPEKLTARAVRLAESHRASVGGRAIHMVARGIKAVMAGPRPHYAGALAAPVIARPPVSQLSLPKRTQCPSCHLWFPSRNKALRHFDWCRRIRLAVIT